VLLAFFLPLTRRTCAELAFGDETVSAYLADVLVEFARSDRLYCIQTHCGRRLTRVVEMLGFKRALFGWEVQRAFHRYLGDYTLFMSGLFRPFVERDGYLGCTCQRAHGRTRALRSSPTGRAENGSSTKSSPPASSTTLARSTTCARSASPVFSGPDPIGAFLREIAGVVDGP
jgi:hypothetical protein